MSTPASPPPEVPSATKRHPHLLLSGEDVEPLRRRANTEPWRTWRHEAVAMAAQLHDDPQGEIRSRAENLATALSVNALAFILDPDGADDCRRRIIDLIDAFDPAARSSLTSLMQRNQDKMVWNYAVPTGNAFVQAVLALDIVHDHLSADELDHAEAVLRDGPARYFRQTPLAWHQGTWASAAIWALYQGDVAVYQPIVEEWLADIDRSITPDGVFSGGTGYAIHRWTAPDREHKALFGELLARAGAVPRWYDRPRLGRFQEWLNGYAFTPFRVAWTVGDGSAAAFRAGEHTGPTRAYRYSRLAGSYAAWLSQGKPFAVSLSGYVLTEESGFPAMTAPSRVFADGGAWLKESSADPQALAGVVLNLRHCHDGHAHKETGAVVLAGYGEQLLRGGGYNGWQTGEQGFSWDYIHHRAVSSSTVLLDYPVPTDPAAEASPSAINDHVGPSGAGIIDELLTGRIDSAVSDSGPAIPNGHHLRSLLFVHPQDGAAGYFVTLDEIDSTTASTAQVVWHPASTQHEEVAAGLIHDWTIKEHSDDGAQLAVILATPPGATTLHQGISTEWGNGRLGRYLVGHYDLGRASTSIMTVLFPHDQDHQLATVERRADAGLTTASIGQGDVTDRLFSGSGTRAVDLHRGIQAVATGGLLRYVGDTLTQWWLQNVTLLAGTPIEFSSERPVTAFQRDHRYQISARRSTVVRFGGGDLAEVLVDGAPVPRGTADENGWSVVLEAGHHSVELIVR